MKTSSCCVITAVHSDSDTWCYRDRNSALPTRSFSLQHGGSIIFHARWIFFPFSIFEDWSFVHSFYFSHATPLPKIHRGGIWRHAWIEAWLSTRGNLNHKKECAMGANYQIHGRNHRLRFTSMMTHLSAVFYVDLSEFKLVNRTTKNN